MARPLQIFEQWELAVCRTLTRFQRVRVSHRLFPCVSRLGDGVIWYALMLALPVLYGAGALAVSIQMACVGALGTVLYRLLKQTTRRVRPLERNGELFRGVPPLDRFSFPSGHTLHAVTFTVLLTAYAPALGWFLIPFTTLVAVSRLVLGLHYPTDVVAGALLGAALGQIGLAIGAPAFLETALALAPHLLGPGAPLLP